MDDTQVQALSQKFLAYAQTSSAAMDAMKTELDQYQARIKEAAALEAALKADYDAAYAELVKHARTADTPEQRANLERALQEKKATIELIKRLADPANTTRPQPLGQPQATKQANGAYTPNGLCGIRNGRSTPADEVYERHFSR